MKLLSVAVLAAVGMAASGAGAYWLAPDGAAATAERRNYDDVEDEAGEGDANLEEKVGSFTTSGTLEVEARLGHEQLKVGADGQTYVMVQVRGTERPGATTRTEANLSLVIDRSGSMRGARMQNAQAAAIRAVDGLTDGDTVSVVSFDTIPVVVVPPTRVDASSRQRIREDIRNIQLGGDTCVSCGIETGLGELTRTPSKVNRMLLLSDGDANSGVRDVPGFRRIGERARSAGVNITTIGVDLLYNEQILTAIASESNGRHYFVQSAADLTRVFAQEATQLTSSVASEATVEVDLANDVELVKVLDRTFTRSGSRITVPLGTFSPGETKTVLMAVRPSADNAGVADVADVGVRFRDLSKDELAVERGTLRVRWSDDKKSVFDALVAGRVQRTETADALESVNELWAQGKFAEANERLRRTKEQVKQTSRAAPSSPKAKLEFEDDLLEQEKALDGAAGAFKPGEASPANPFEGDGAKAGAKQSASDQFDLRL